MVGCLHAEKHIVHHLAFFSVVASSQIFPLISGQRKVLFRKETKLKSHFYNILTKASAEKQGLLSQ
ncbi:hypothetical protein BZG01_16540 [Labilibaculum manganireducens]|uniref:Uncharacterized protein n=1 Tax=Labilibaculum manganireducens TaxID=1940525 RepID=A0A2N3HY48_9BACT|nr:hypothetical protein BZG01_16540 [Labilibaculum manganireducens]